MVEQTSAQMAAGSDVGLAACPCGKPITELGISDAGQGGKWAWASGDCCGEWSIEFRTQYEGLDSDECKRLAREAWNNAQRVAREPNMTEPLNENESADGRSDSNCGLAGTCRKCGGEMQPGKAIAQTFDGIPDFIGGEVCTVSAGGPGKLIGCMKCKNCGWSVTATIE